MKPIPHNVLTEQKFGTTRQKVLRDPSILNLGGYTAYIVKHKLIKRNQCAPHTLSPFHGETLRLQFQFTGHNSNEAIGDNGRIDLMLTAFSLVP